MRLVRTLLIALLCQALQSQTPAPTPGIKRNPPQQPATGAKDQPSGDKRGTEQSPIFIKILPAEKAQDEASNVKTPELDKSSADWWMVRVTAAIAVIGLIQTIVFGIQAYMLRSTISKMDEIAGGQAKDVQASIAEATRAASAMEGISVSMASNVESVRESVGITREIADRQKLISELQSRAYLATVFEVVLSQNIATGFKFEVRHKIINQGHTPAHNIRYSMFADVQSFPLSDNFSFPLPAEVSGHCSDIGPGLHKIIAGVVSTVYSETEEEQIKLGARQRIVSWGMITYQDAFDIERFVRFGFTHYFVGGDGWMSQDTIRHNEAN